MINLVQKYQPLLASSAYHSQHETYPNSQRAAYGNVANPAHHTINSEVTTPAHIQTGHHQATPITPMIILLYLQKVCHKTRTTLSYLTK